MESRWNKTLGPDFSKYLTIYHKIILSLSSDRLTIATYNVLKFLPEILYANLRTLSQTILQVNTGVDKGGPAPPPIAGQKKKIFLLK